MSWCFSIVNNRLAEIYFNDRRKKHKIFGHCYVARKDYKTKQEKDWIRQDTNKLRFVYRNGRYKGI